MFTIIQRPNAFPHHSFDAGESSRHASLGGMDIDAPDFGLGEGPPVLHRTVVSPGEMITSSKDFMRSATDASSSLL